MSYKIIGKYIKELNFNIPNPKTFFLLSKDIANYKINIDIKSSQSKTKYYRSSDKLNLLQQEMILKKLIQKLFFQQ